MTEENLTEIIGRIVDVTDNRGNQNPEYTFVFEPENSEGSRIFVKYASYNPMIWENVRNEYLHCEHGLHAKLLIKGKVDKLVTDYEGVGLVKINPPR